MNSVEWAKEQRDVPTDALDKIAEFTPNGNRIEYLRKLYHLQIDACHPEKKRE